METKHTPTPWKWRTPRTGCRQAYLVGSGEIPIAYLAQPELQDPRKRKANATFIVRACNNHDALLEACRAAMIAMQNLCQAVDDEPADGMIEYEQCKAAIALAEKGG